MQLRTRRTGQEIFTRAEQRLRLKEWKRNNRRSSYPSTLVVDPTAARYSISRPIPTRQYPRDTSISLPPASRTSDRVEEDITVWEEPVGKYSQLTMFFPYERHYFVVRSLPEVDTSSPTLTYRNIVVVRYIRWGRETEKKESFTCPFTLPPKSKVAMEEQSKSFQYLRPRPVSTRRMPTRIYNARLVFIPETNTYDEVDYVDAPINGKTNNIPPSLWKYEESADDDAFVYNRNNKHILYIGSPAIATVLVRTWPREYAWCTRREYLAMLIALRRNNAIVVRHPKDNRIEYVGPKEEVAEYLGNRRWPCEPYKGEILQWRR